MEGVSDSLSVKAEAMVPYDPCRILSAAGAVELSLFQSVIVEEGEANFLIGTSSVSVTKDTLKPLQPFLEEPASNSNESRGSQLGSQSNSGRVGWYVMSSRYTFVNHTLTPYQDLLRASGSKLPYWYLAGISTYCRKHRTITV